MDAKQLLAQVEADRKAEELARIERRKRNERNWRLQLNDALRDRAIVAYDAKNVIQEMVLVRRFGGKAWEKEMMDLKNEWLDKKWGHVLVYAEYARCDADVIEAVAYSMRDQDELDRLLSL